MIGERKDESIAAPWTSAHARDGESAIIPMMVRCSTVEEGPSETFLF